MEVIIMKKVMRSICIVLCLTMLMGITAFAAIPTMSGGNAHEIPVYYDLQKKPSNSSWGRKLTVTEITDTANAKIDVIILLSIYYLLYSAKSSLAAFEFIYCFIYVFGSKIRPKLIGKIKLRISSLPKKKVGYPQISACSYYHI